MLTMSQDPAGVDARPRFGVRPMFQLIYVSRPFGFDTPTLIDILVKARARNSEAGVTGALLCRDDLYLQLLEGPREGVDDIFASIAEDDRHVDIRTIVRRKIQTRMFPGWAMRDDPMKTWMWSREEIAQGAADRASSRDAIALFTRLSAATPKLVAANDNGQIA